MSRVRLLYLEDSPLDVDLLRARLAREPTDFDLRVVSTRSEFESAVTAERFDLILADHTLPDYDGGAALEFARGVCPDVPFIFVSGTLGEELAVSMLKLGATDYILKQRLDRLGPAVVRAIEEARPGPSA